MSQRNGITRQPAVLESGDRFAPDVTVEEVLSRLKAAMSGIEEKVIEAARCVRWLVDHGHTKEVVECLDSFWAPHLRRIASGHEAPGIIGKYGFSKRKLCDAMAELPIDDQQSLLSAGGLNLMVFDTAGRRSMQWFQLDNLGNEQIRQAFDRGSIRNETQQSAWLANERTKQMLNKGTEEYVGKWKRDDEREGWQMGQHFLSDEDIKKMKRLASRRAK